VEVRWMEAAKEMLMLETAHGRGVPSIVLLAEYIRGSDLGGAKKGYPRIASESTGPSQSALDPTVIGFGAASGKNSTASASRSM